MKTLAFCLFLLSAISTQAFTSTDNCSPSKEIVCTGVINGNAISLPKPEYPATAKAVGAGGVVSIEVTVDEEGNVISAEAVSGHPLLRAVSTEAAKQAKFKPTMLSGKPVKITGIIVYNFMPPEPMITWRTAGYAMALAEDAEELPLDFPAGPIGGFIPNSWNDERSEIAKLSAIQHSVKSSGERSSELATAKEKIDVASINHKQVLSGLKTSFENRLLSAQNDVWNFRFGLLLGKITAQMGDEDVLRANLAELQPFAAGPVDQIKLINALIELGRKSELTPDDLDRIKGTVEKL